MGTFTGRTYTVCCRKMISLCYLDTEYATSGTEFTLIWGDSGIHRKKTKVIVACFRTSTRTPTRPSMPRLFCLAWLGAKSR